MKEESPEIFPQALPDHPPDTFGAPLNDQYFATTGASYQLNWEVRPSRTT